MYNELFNKAKTKSFRRIKRNSMTPAEVLLWKRLKGKQIGYKFRRQHGIGPYIVDFYCPEKQLVIELDGNTHEDQEVENKDHKKDSFLIQKGFTVLRFWNSDLYDSIEGALQKIKSALK